MPNEVVRTECWKTEVRRQKIKDKRLSPLRKAIRAYVSGAKAHKDCTTITTMTTHNNHNIQNPQQSRLRLPSMKMPLQGYGGRSITTTTTTPSPSNRKYAVFCYFCPHE